MLSQILGIFGEGLRSSFGWFSDIVDSTGTYALIIGVFAMGVMYRVLIVPLIGSTLSAGSDTVRSAYHRYGTKKGRQASAAKRAASNKEE